METIAIISASVRNGRKSHRVSIYIKKIIEYKKLASVVMLDLMEYNFPLFEERFKFQKSPAEKTIDFTNKFKNAGGIIIVTPEYNGGYPAALKNVIDLFEAEWKHKPVALSTVSNGQFGGAQTTTSLTFTLWKLKALVSTTSFPVPNIDKSFNEDNMPFFKEKTDKRADNFLNELLWCMKLRRNELENNQ